MITSLGAQPEVASLGHNPYRNKYIEHAVVLPTRRARFLCEALEGAAALEGTAFHPGQLLANREARSEGPAVHALKVKTLFSP